MLPGHRHPEAHIGAATAVRALTFGAECLGATDPVPTILAVHQVHEVGSVDRVHLCGHDVVRCAGQGHVTGFDDRDPALVVTLGHRGDPGWFQRVGPQRGEHLVADGHRFDRHRPVRGAHRRARRKALVGVAHYADVAVVLGEEHHQVVLHRVGVLVLVDEHVAEPLLVVVQHLGVDPEQLHGDRQQVIEVHRASGAQTGLVLGVDLRDLAFGDHPSGLREVTG